MAFRPPTFNLLCNIWRNNGTGGAYAAPDLPNQPCCLSPGRRVERLSGSTVGPFAPMPMELLLPKLTDVRATWNGVLADLVEVPVGSKRFYIVGQVDDTGKGYPNEYRIAWMAFFTNSTMAGTFGFPVPVPLP